MTIGRDNPLPLEVGGGPTEFQRTYGILRRAVGEGGSASNEEGIDGLWRRSKAMGLVAAFSAERRAIYQADPRLATDLLPYYERLFQIVPPPNATMTQRAEAVAQRFYERSVVDVRNLEQELQRIDSRLRILELPYERAVVAQLGRAFEGHDSNLEGPPFNLMTGRRHTLFPMYSSALVVRVRFDLGYSGAPTESDKRILQRVRSLLRRSLSSDTTFSISTGPWVLGVTPIGLGEVA